MRRQRAKKSPIKRLTSILIRLALLAFVVFAGITFLIGQSKLGARKETLIELKDKLSGEQAYNRELNDVLEEGMTSEYVETKAREAGFVYPDERVYYDHID